MDTDNIKVNTCTIVNPVDVFLQYKCLPINPYAEISCQHDVTSQYTALNTVTSILREDEPKSWLFTASCKSRLYLDTDSQQHWIDRGSKRCHLLVNGTQPLYQYTRYLLFKHLLEKREKQKCWLRIYTCVLSCQVGWGAPYSWQKDKLLIRLAQISWAFSLLPSIDGGEIGMG